MAIDELILKYLRGELNLEEQHRLTKWLKEEDMSPMVLEKILLFWKDPKNKYIEQRDEVQQKIFQKLVDSKRKETTHTDFTTQRRPVQKYFWIAATISLVVILSFIINRSNLIHESPPPIVKYESRKTRSGQKLQVHLKDGSQIKLNAESSIEFPKYFSDSTRTVSLNGEAYFEVARDTLRPFQVIVGNVVVKALGTSFSIRSEPGTTKVFLTSGKVSVSSPKVRDAVILTPGEMVTENKGFLNGVNVFEYAEIAWKDNILIFNEASSSQVFQKLEKWYGVNIHISDELGAWSFSGRFENEPLKEVLIGISHSEDFDFEIRNNEVIIKNQSKQMNIRNP